MLKLVLDAKRKDSKEAIKDLGKRFDNMLILVKRKNVKKLI